MSAHTPGPWHVVNAKDVFTALGAPNAAGVCADHNDGWQIADCGGGECFVDGFAHELSMGEERANARLIAAAPELLEALTIARDLIAGDLVGAEWKQACHDFLRQANAAIAKATGEAQ